MALAGDYPGTEVTSMDLSNIVHATTTKVQLLLEYNEAGHSYHLPPTMLVKCGFEVHSANLTKFARSEVVFYRERAPALKNDVNAPKCYFGGVDENAGTAFILLEDLGARNATFGFALKPITPEIALRGVAMLARYHAKWWNSPGPLSFDPPGGQFMADTWCTTANFAECIKLPRFEHVPPVLRDPANFRNVFYKSWESNARGPLCLIHGDTHLGNWFFEPDHTPGLLDWQGDVRHCWAHDITEFILTALEIEDRRKHDRSVLAFYLEELRSHGVDAPSFDTAWLQYRRNTIWAGAAALCPLAMQSEEVLTAYTQRAMTAFIELESLASLEE